MTDHQVLVCTGCTHGVRKKERSDPRGGALLATALEESLNLAHQAGRLSHPVHVARVSCLSSCSRSCTVAFRAKGKFAFVIADLKGADDAEALVQFAQRYVDLEDGKVRKAERPESLQKKVLTRLPPTH